MAYYTKKIGQKIKELAAYYCYSIIELILVLLHIVSMLASGAIVDTVTARGMFMFVSFPLITVMVFRNKIGKMWRVFPVICLSIYKWEPFIYGSWKMLQISGFLNELVIVVLISAVACITVQSLFASKDIVAEILWRLSLRLYIGIAVIWPLKDLVFVTFGTNDLHNNALIDSIYYNVAIIFLLAALGLETKPDTIGIGVKKVWKWGKIVLVAAWISFSSLIFLDFDGTVTSDMRQTVIISFFMTPFLVWVAMNFVGLFHETMKSISEVKKNPTRREAYVYYENRDYAKEYFEKSILFSVEELTRLYELQMTLKSYLSERLIDEKSGRNGFSCISEEELEIFEELERGFGFKIDYDALMDKEG